VRVCRERWIETAAGHTQPETTPIQGPSTASDDVDPPATPTKPASTTSSVWPEYHAQVAVEGAQLVVLAVPGTGAPVVAGGDQSCPGQAVIVDATNPFNGTYSDLAIEGTSGAESVQRSAGSVPVVKAFNTIFASRYDNPVENGTLLQVLFAGMTRPPGALSGSCSVPGFRPARRRWPVVRQLPGGSGRS
jgi:hypothetical protein